MKIKDKVLAVALTASIGIIGMAGAGCGTTKYSGLDISNVGFAVEATISEGHTIYEPQQNWGYRYGPTLMYNKDGVIEGYFSGPPERSTGAWDDLFYRTSADYGETWTDDVAGVMPVAGSREDLSCCDPTAFKYNGYYYVLYTSTIEPQGRYNDVYGCRSTSPTGPWEKWNGREWKGSDPQPIVFYGSNAEHYGIGEPSAVIVGDKIYLYYTYKGPLGNGAVVNQTRVAIGDITKEDWPLTLKEQGVAVGGKTDEEDSLDVKYVDGYDMFIGVTTRRRFTTKAHVQFYQSDDGITFYEIYNCIGSSTATKTNTTKARLHNIGITGDELGHIDLNKPQFISYAFAKSGLDWGFWSTEINRVEFKFTQVKNYKEILGDTVSIEGEFPDGVAPAAWALSQVSDARNASMALDGNTLTFYQSLPHTDYDSNPWHSGKWFAEALAVTAANGQAKGMKVTPVLAGDNVVGFPRAFTLQSSNDGIFWETVKSFSDYTAANGNEITFQFDKTVKAKYFRLYATELNQNQFGAYVLQIAEMSLI